MAHLFGAGAVYDAFVVGFRIPNLMRDLFAEGALSSAFIPTLTRYLASKTRAEARELSNLVATSIILIVGGICILGTIFSPALVFLLAGGFRAVPGKFELTVELTRIMFPFLLLVALAAQAMGVLNALNRFGVPALSSTFFNIGSVTAGLILGFWLGPSIGIEPIEGMAWGVVVGGALQLLWQVPLLVREGFGFRPRLDMSHPGLRQIFALMGPAILGGAAVQINVTVNTNFASSITNAAGQVIDGPASWLTFAFRFMQLPLGLFGVAIASATLPAISRNAETGDMNAFRHTLTRSLGLVFLLTIPSSVGLHVLGPAMIGAIYEGGRFSAWDTRQTALALSCYAIGLAGYSAIKVLTPAFYAVGDARTPMTVSLASIIINFCAAFAMVRILGMGHAGLALSTSLVAVCGFLALMIAMERRIGGIEKKALGLSVLKILVASGAMGAVCWLSTGAVEAWLGTSRFARLADLAISIPLGLLVFYTACRLMKVTELEAGLRAVAGPLARRFGVRRDTLR